MFTNMATAPPRVKLITVPDQLKKTKCLPSLEIDKNRPCLTVSSKRKLDDDLTDETDSSSKRVCTKQVEQEEEDVCVEEDEMMSEKQLWFLANEFEDLAEWKCVGTALGLSNNDVQSIHGKHAGRGDGLNECLYQCLLKWRVRQPENCRVGHFTRLLLDKLNKSVEFVKELQRKFQVFSEDKLYTEKNIETLYFYIKQLKNKRTFNEKCLKTKLSDSDLWSASSFFFQEWKTVSRCLGLNESELVSIECKHLQADGMRECCYQSMLVWSQVFYEQATLKHLCVSLIDMRLNLYAKQLLEKFAN